MTEPRTLARTAGLLYLVVAGGGILTLLVSPGRSATADQLRAGATLFRIGLVSSLIAGICWLGTAMALYLLLRHVHQLAAAAMVTFVAVGVANSYLGVADDYLALRIALDHKDSRFTRLLLDSGTPIDAVLFGLWLVPLGYLVIRSGYFPKVLGIFLIAGCVGYLVGGVVFALGPLSELAFMAWLLMPGPRTRSAALPATDADVGARNRTR